VRVKYYSCGPQRANPGDEIKLAQRLTPDVVVTDLNLPGQSGIDLISELRKLVPGSKGIVFTMHNDNEYVRAALSLPGPVATHSKTRAAQSSLRPYLP
jgi:DNA-binding NarL/FixJ family response regulator